jgi:hypothetical protein
MVNVSEASHEVIRAIERWVQSRTHGRVRDLQVELAGQSIVLRGRAPTYHTKQLALLGAMDAVSDGRIVNEIRVG